MGLHATEKLWRLTVVDRDFLWYLTKQLKNFFYSEDFCNTHFLILTAREKIAKMSMWQLDFRQNWSVFDETNDCASITLP